MEKLEKVLKKVAAALSDAGAKFADGVDPEAGDRTPSAESVGVNSGAVITIKEFAHEKHWTTFISVENDTGKATVDILKDALGGKKRWTDFRSYGHYWAKGDVGVDISDDGKSIVIREEFERAGRL